MSCIGPKSPGQFNIVSEDAKVLPSVPITQTSRLQFFALATLSFNFLLSDNLASALLMQRNCNKTKSLELLRNVSLFKCKMGSVLAEKSVFSKIY